MRRCRGPRLRCDTQSFCAVLKPGGNLRRRGGTAPLAPLAGARNGRTQALPRTSGSGQHCGGPLLRLVFGRQTRFVLQDFDIGEYPGTGDVTRLGRRGLLQHRKRCGVSKPA